jgi:1-acyl-sn-glycerol-3-phosphate acyltransferase
MLFVRSLLYTTLLFASVIPHALWVLIARPFGYHAALKSAYWWGRLQLWGLRVICGIDYRVEGLEHVPRDRAVICYMKHTSAWETIAQCVVFPAQAWVLKRELMWIPILGWALWALDSIHIDRGAGRNAVRQVVDQGKDMLAAGHWVMIFPEGTRMPPGTTRRYGVSGSILARDTGTPILPVAHNAGDYWQRNSLLKHPGTVTMRIGPLIQPRGRDPIAINAEAQAWIEAQMKQLSPGYAGRVVERKKGSGPVLLD